VFSGTGKGEFFSSSELVSYKEMMERMNVNERMKK
jgi:hypothetical protein